jgi:Flp pilus assembly pilin Flp
VRVPQRTQPASLAADTPAKRGASPPTQRGSSMSQRLRALLADERGLTTVEYVIVLCLIAAVSVGLWGDLGDMITGHLDRAVKGLDAELSEDL